MFFFFIVVSAARFCPSEIPNSVRGVSIGDSPAELLLATDGDVSSEIERIGFDFFPEKVRGTVFCSIDAVVDVSSADWLCLYMPNATAIRLHFSSPHHGVVHERQIILKPTQGNLRIDIVYSGKKQEVTVFVDGEENATVWYNSSHHLPGRGKFYIGGIPDEHTSTSETSRFRSQIVPRDFKGCISPPNITFSDGRTKTARFMNSANWNNKMCSLENDCSPLSRQSCLNGGVCVKGLYGNWQCDCRRTGFNGPKCEESKCVCVCVCVCVRVCVCACACVRVRVCMCDSM